MRLFFAIFIFLFSPLYAKAPPFINEKTGILVMAHGGDKEWDAAVEEAVHPLQSVCPVKIAFGMADREALQNAVHDLESEGVDRVAVVRLFVSTESFGHQTEYLLALRSDPPPVFISHSHVMHQKIETEKKPVHHEVPLPVEKKSTLIMNREGLFDSALIGEIIVDRIRAQSVSPKSESLLILAHGPEDDAENYRWIMKISRLIGGKLDLKQFRNVVVETLREDWPGKRLIVEKRIRDFVKKGNRKGGRVIVVPFRVFGFGPYRETLHGLKYSADGMGLLPHPNVTEWIRVQAQDCFARGGWKNPFKE